MFKRMRWMTVGFGAGVGVTVWAEVKLRQKTQQFTPAAVGEQAAKRVKSLGDDVRDAVRDGRQAMRDREAQLRTQHGVGPDPQAGAAPQLRALPGSGGRSRSVRGPGRSGPAVPWSDHGHERSSARLS